MISKFEKELETLMQTIRTQDRELGFCIGKSCRIDNKKCEKRNN